MDRAASTSAAPSTVPSFLPREMDHASVPLSYDLLKEITNDFSEERKIGSGTYGRVYRGVHKDGKTIAVKMLYDMPGLDDVQFKREFNNLESLRHDNIVRLVGYCHETRQEYVKFDGRMVVVDKIHRALCFEYAHNGSLHEKLSDEYSGLDWRTRYGIIKGICNGLKYMHQELKPPMYHLDIKPANVLLDENLSPKVADFGLSRLFGEDQTKITISAMGTRGYLPPEYIEQNVISNKFDIFSLGVVIIKIMAGPDGYYKCGEMSSREFVKLVHGNWRARLQAPPMCEPEAEAYYEQVKTCIETALRCVEADRHKRPSIMDIVDKMNETETRIRLCPSQVSSKVLQSFASAITGLRRFEHHELANATNRFSKERELGEGAFGLVYKGSYTDENGKQEVAVKRIKRYTGDFWDFIAELQAISGTRHMNLVKLKGWCCSQDIWNLINFIGWFRQQKVQLFLVFELVPNGNLDYHLHSADEILPWGKRNIKPSNVLLDYDFNAKLCGFTLARIASQSNATLVSYAIGTPGYMDPHIMRDGDVEFSRKTDVYSFGIVLLEIACTNMSRKQVWELYRRCATEPEVMEDAADRRLCGVFDRMEMVRVIVLGLWCSHPDEKRRPSMLDVMKFLEEGIELPAITEIEEGIELNAIYKRNRGNRGQHRAL